LSDATTSSSTGGCDGATLFMHVLAGERLSGDYSTGQRSIRDFTAKTHR